VWVVSDETSGPRQDSAGVDMIDILGRYARRQGAQDYQVRIHRW
jgi:hypothetical protein